MNDKGVAVRKKKQDASLCDFRMCKLLGQRFVEYLPVVMGPLMKAASIRPEVTMLDSQDVDAIDEDDGWEFIKLGDQVTNSGAVNVSVYGYFLKA